MHTLSTPSRRSVNAEKNIWASSNEEKDMQLAGLNYSTVHLGTRWASVFVGQRYWSSTNHADFFSWHSTRGRAFLNLLRLLLVGWGTMLQAGRWRVRVSMRWIFELPNPSSSTMSLRSTQPLTEMSTRNLPGGKGQPARKADNLTTIYEAIA
jgi:hypothetical protein